MTRTFLLLASLGLVALTSACGDAGGSGLTDPQPSAGAGQGGAAGQSGAAGKAGTAGTAGKAGAAGSTAGQGGAGGEGGAGASGASGQAGQGGAAGEAGAAGAAGDAGQAGAAGSAGSGPPPCAAGKVQCNGILKQVCDGKGGFSEETPCAKACVDALGCVECVPGTGSCEGNKALRCKADGTGYEETVCDPELGLSCQDGQGVCKGPCSADNLNRSYIGCEYFPTVTSNGGLFSGFSFAIVVANTSGEEANLVVRRNDQVIAMTSVAPNSLQTIKLPWVEELRNSYEDAQFVEDLDNALTSKLVKGGAYHVKSTRPVTVYQFNPLEFKIPDPGNCPIQPGTTDCNSYTNDASLLLPVNALGDEYFVSSSAPLVSQQGSILNSFFVQIPGMVAVTATQDDTSVILTSNAYVRPGDGVQAMNPGGSQTFKLNRGDVVQLLAGKAPDSAVVGCTDSGSGTSFCTLPKTYDLTGSIIAATKPIMVLGGHDCLRTPYNKAACDHIEETMFPTNTLGNQVIVTAPQAVSSAASGDGKADQHMIRVISADDNNVIELDPPDIAPGGVLNKGGYADVPINNKDFVVKGSKAIMVAQYMLSADQVDPNNSGTINSKGDPALSLGIPSVQYRTLYTFLAPESYTFNYVNIVATTGSTVKLDGESLVVNGPAIGSSGYSVLRKKIAGGPHNASSDEPFGIVVYGYGQYTSYMYPGGLNLNKL